MFIPHDSASIEQTTSSLHERQLGERQLTTQVAISSFKRIRGGQSIEV